MVILKFLGNLTCMKFEGNIEEAIEQKEKLFNVAKTVGNFTYISDGVSAGGGFNTASKARTKYGRLCLGNMVSYSMDRACL